MRRLGRSAISLLAALCLVTTTMPVLAADPVVLDPIGDKEATAGELLTFEVAATGGANLGYVFEGPSPEGSDLGQESGIFTWTPRSDQVGEHIVSIVAVDLTDFTNNDGEEITITVGPAGGGDSVPPIVTITAPAEAGVYQVGDQVLADYACTDADSGIASCLGDVQLGQPIDTSTPGPHTFTVTGTDNAGNTTTVAHNYEVVSPVVMITVTEVVGVDDAPAIPTVVRISVTETIDVSDGANVTTPTAPVTITISESIVVSDASLVLPALLISISEAVGVSEVSTVAPQDLPSISGTKWEDLDGDGTRESGEDPLSGVVIYLDMDDNSELDPGERWTTTDTVGAYLFTEVGPGDWVVREIAPEDYTQTFPDPALDPAHRVVVSSVDVAGLDFGNMPMVDLPPSIEQIPDLTADIGVPIVVRPRVIDPEGDPYILRWDGVPSTAVTNGIFEWTPDVADGGMTYDITVTAVQADKPENYSAMTFSLSVNQNDPPVIEPIDDVFAIPGDEFVVAPTYFDPDDDPLLHSWEGAPPNAVTNGIFVLTPDDSQASQVFEVTLTVTEDTPAAQFATETFHVLVGGIPDMADGPVAVAAGQMGQITVSGEGYQPDSEVGIYMFSDPTLLGTATVDTDGSFTTLLQIPAEAPAGTHTIVVMGIGSAGELRTLTSEVEVESDPDPDRDGLTTVEEALTGTDPEKPDSDGDGVIDGLDASWLLSYLDAIPGDAFKKRWHRTAMKLTVTAAAIAVNLGERELANSILEPVSRRVDGCGVVPDRSDWIVDCESQIELRELLDLYRRGIATLSLPNPFGVE